MIRSSVKTHSLDIPVIDVDLKWESSGQDDSIGIVDWGCRQKVRVPVPSGLGDWWGKNMLRRTLQIIALCVGAFGLALPAQAQFRFTAEALFMDRDNDGGRQLLNGPDSISSGGDNGFQTGHRFTLGASYDAFDLEFIAAQIYGWDYSSTGTLTSPLIFDDTATNPLFAVPAPNTLAFTNTLYNAATAITVEDDESERLKAGATWYVNGSSNFQDYQINVGTNPTRNPWRVSLGWRQMRLNEANGIGISGTFDALDTATGAAPGGFGDGPNNALSDGALTDAGFSLLSGTGNGYDASAQPPEGPDTLLIYYQSGTQNLLNGAQVSGSYDLFPESPIDLTLLGRFGVFNNEASATLGEYLVGSQHDDSVYQRTYAKTKNTVAFGGTLGATAMFPLTDYISATMGYEATFVSNLALAPSQVSGLSNTPVGARNYSVNTSGQLILHGATLGLLVTW